MAVVWRATDTRLDRKVAVKVLHARLAGDANFRERFRREAVSAASFNHPNIVTVFDTGESGASHYIVMELVEGPSLSRLLGKNGTLTPGETVTLLRAVLAGLAYAHERGVVHRDIKPANILLSARAAAGAVKLGDFGIARAHTATDLTATGAIIGTASYLSPEQAEGKGVDHRADLYSLACVAYRCLSGRLPWTADTELGVALARTMRPPDPLGRLPGADPRLTAVIERGLVREVGARFQSAEQMTGALAGLPSEPIRLEPRTEERRVVQRPAGNGHAKIGANGSEPHDGPPAIRQATAPRFAPDPVSQRPGRTPARRVPNRSRPDARPRARVTQPRPTAVQYRRRRWIVALAAVILVAVVVMFGFGSSRTADSPPTTTPPAANQSLEPKSVRDFDPPPGGDGKESPMQTSAVVDGDADTKWSTEPYNSPQDFKGLKEGVGLIFEFQGPVTPREVKLTVSPGTDFELRTADRLSNDIRDWQLVEGSERHADGRGRVEVSVPTGDVTARYWLLWITGVAKVNGKGQSSVYDVAFGSGE